MTAKTSAQKATAANVGGLRERATLGCVLTILACVSSLAWADDSLPQKAPVPALPTRDIGRSLFSPDDGLFVLNRGDSIEVRRVDTGEIAMRIAPAGLAVHAVAFSPDGNTIAAGGSTPRDVGEVRLWDAKTGQELHRTTGFKAGLHNVHFSPDGPRLLVLDISDRSAHLIDVKSGDATFSAACLVKYTTTDLDFSADGRWLCAPLNRAAVVWDAATGEERCRLLPLQAETTIRNNQEFAITRLNSAGTMAAALAQDANNESAINLYDAADGRLLRSLSVADRCTYDFAFSPDGKLLAAGLDDSTYHAPDDAEVRVWDAATGGMIRSLPLQGDPTQVWFSPDGSRVYTHGFKEVNRKRAHFGHFWNVETGEDLGSEQLFRPTFSRSGKFMLSNSRLFDVETGKVIREYR